jgi:hypothetical protein
LRAIIHAVTDVQSEKSKIRAFLSESIGVAWASSNGSRMEAAPWWQDPWNDAVSFWFICCWCLIKRALHGMNASWTDDFDMLIIIESWRAKARPVVWKVLKKNWLEHACTYVNNYINQKYTYIYIYNIDIYII